jgi:amidohydrolase family protein
MKMTTEILPGIATPDKVETSIGTLNLFDGVPDKETAQKVYDNLDFQRGVQAYLSSIQIASMAWYDNCAKEGGVGIGVLHAYFPGAGSKELMRVWELAAKYNVPTYTHIQNVSMLDPKSGVASRLQLAGLAVATGAHTHVCHMNKEMKASPEDAVIIHFLDEDNNPHDASLLDMSVLYPGGAVVTDALTYCDEKGEWYLGDDWPLPKGLQSHPRHAGNYGHFMRKWVRERGVLSWMDAIAKCTLIPAQIIEDAAPMMKKKGRLQEGCDADIVVFDPKTFTDKATFKDPALLSEGMKHVIVNGAFLIRDAKLDAKAMPGQPIRGPIVG